MNNHEFIHRNVKALLLKSGFDFATANSAANHAVGFYNKLHGSRTKKGHIFDDVLFEAKNYAQKIQKSH